MGLGVTTYTSAEDFLSEVSQEMVNMRRFTRNTALYGTWLTTVGLLVIAFVSEPVMIAALLVVVGILHLIYHKTDWIVTGVGRVFTAFYLASRVPRFIYISEADYYLRVATGSIELRIPEYTVSGSVKDLHLGAHVLLQFNVGDSESLHVVTTAFRELHQVARQLQSQMAQAATPHRVD